MSPLQKSAQKPTASQHVIPLQLLAAGETGDIMEIDGRSDVVMRLHEMGLRPGCHVQMIRSGSACIVGVENHRFSFRCGDAAHVLVAVRDAHSPATHD